MLAIRIRSAACPFATSSKPISCVLAELRSTAVAAQQTDAFAAPTKSAALVSTPVMFGIVRQWAALSGDGNLETRPFFDEAEALLWLRE